ncbi:MAG: site-2 protease family protein [Coriobacteriia bacterium]|nr:site-2 protease family protein [Coriobacteriia bacterium]
MSTVANIALWAAKLLILFGSIILHEISHGYAALKMGDTTAKDAHRLSLNPLKHIDPFGTIIMPAAMLLISQGSFAFGYAKPVPINPRRFKNERSGMLITGIAGPMTNIGLAILAGVAYRGIGFVAGTSSTFIAVVAYLLSYMAFMNLVLAFFNLIPLPPLDGSRVVQRFLPTKARDAYHRLEPYGFVIIMATIWFFPQVFNAYLVLTVTPVFNFLVGA